MVKLGAQEQNADGHLPGDFLDSASEVFLAKFRAWGPVAELLVAAGLWGFGFIATKWALEAVDAFEVSFLRFVLASLVGLPFLLAKPARAKFNEYARRSFVPALFLVATLTFQTWGLLYTSATKSGFITTLYVVFVPILELLLRGRRLPARLVLCVLSSFLGMLLIVGLGFSPLNFGDVLTFACALTAAGQIYWMGVVSPCVDRPFVFNIYQCVWSLLLTVPFLYGHELRTKIGHIAEWPTHALLGTLSLALGSTVIAFYLQVRAQARLSATVSSLMFLLESPFALFFAMMLLGESLRLTEALGAAIIFASALFATTFEKKD